MNRVVLWAGTLAATTALVGACGGKSTSGTTAPQQATVTRGTIRITVNATGVTQYISANNLTFGGRHPGTGKPFAYYETVGGGAGAGPGPERAASGIHVHMSNTRNTPIEALEYAFPIRIEQYSLRRGSGGAGQHPGGAGLRRDIRFLVPAKVTVLSERRRRAPWGLQGGQPGSSGRNILIHNHSEEALPGKFTRTVDADDVLSLQTPGGGGWGEVNDK